MNINIDNDHLDWFEKNNISFHTRFGKRLMVGDRLTFDVKSSIEPYVGFHGGNSLCSMGFMSYTNSGLPTQTEVGRYCSIGAGVTIPNYRHPIEHISTSIFTHDPNTDLVIRAVRELGPKYHNFYQNPQKGNVKINNDVWIGQNVVIMAGVEIGTGSVVAAHSVVTKSVAPYSIIGGNPASVIRHRFPDTIAERLLSSSWWDFCFVDFQKMDLSKPELFLDQLEARKCEMKPFAPRYVPLAELIK